MSSSVSHDLVIKKYPMGPHLRRWWGLEASTEESIKTTPEEQGIFLEELQKKIALVPCKTQEEVISLMEEILAMGFPLLALKFCDGNQSVWQKNNFFGLRLEGLSSLLVGELDRAEESFIAASELAPKEVACYVNLIKIMIEECRWAEAWDWVDQGLTCQPNHFPLWKEIVALLEKEKQKDIISTIKDLETKYKSWAASSLLSEWEENPSPEKKLKRLESYYEHGELSYDFLMEYTGALGVLGQYEKITQVIYQSQSLNGEKIPWQLQTHCLQAHIALEDFSMARKEGKDLLNRKDIPKQTMEHLTEMMKEVGKA